jgi:hypothetical protein
VPGPGGDDGEMGEERGAPVLGFFARMRTERPFGPARAYIAGDLGSTAAARTTRTRVPPPREDASLGPDAAGVAQVIVLLAKLMAA